MLQCDCQVAQALKVLKQPSPILFKNGCSVHFDKRTYSLKRDRLSLFTLEKRVRLQLDISSFHRAFLESGAVKEAELVRKGKRWFFHLVLDLPDVAPVASAEAMGVDFGENVLAAVSTGKLFGGGAHRFSCSHCGSLQHSDLNASRNILRLGLSVDESTGDVNRRHIAALCRR